MYCFFILFGIGVVIAIILGISDGTSGCFSWGAFSALLALMLVLALLLTFLTSLIVSACNVVNYNLRSTEQITLNEIDNNHHYVQVGTDIIYYCYKDETSDGLRVGSCSPSFSKFFYVNDTPTIFINTYGLKMDSKWFWNVACRTEYEFYLPSADAVDTTLVVKDLMTD